MASSHTTDDAFKKTHQTVGAEHTTSGNLNEQIFKDRPEGNAQNFTAGGTRSADDAVERQLAEKGRYTGHASDQQLDEYDALKQKLDKRGNAPQ